MADIPCRVPTLLYLQRWPSVEACAVACVRRSLCYPLYRHWALAQRVWQDVAAIFARGRPALLKALLVRVPGAWELGTVWTDLPCTVTALDRVCAPPLNML